jgi:hypothetical protein
MIIGWVVHHAWRIRETDVEFLVRNLREIDGQTCGKVMLCWQKLTSEVLKVICSGSMKLLELSADRDMVLKDREFSG